MPYVSARAPCTFRPLPTRPHSKSSRPALTWSLGTRNTCDPVVSGQLHQGGENNARLKALWVQGVLFGVRRVVRLVLDRGRGRPGTSPPRADLVCNLSSRGPFVPRREHTDANISCGNA